MRQYTLGFIKKNQQVLMLNREKPYAMGLWNGVGGKVEEGESPEECMVREIFEETTLSINKLENKGVVHWYEDGEFAGDLHVFLIDTDGKCDLQTPVKFDEGILDWKDINWLIHEDNLGISEDAKLLLKDIIENIGRKEYYSYFEKNTFIDLKTNVEEN